MPCSRNALGTRPVIIYFTELAILYTIKRYTATIRHAD